MRSTVVYILRLLVDQPDTGILRGILRDVASGEEHSFSSEQGLLELLYEAPQAAPETVDENQIPQNTERLP